MAARAHRPWACEQGESDAGVLDGADGLGAVALDEHGRDELAGDEGREEGGEQRGLLRQAQPVLGRHLQARADRSQREKAPAAAAAQRGACVLAALTNSHSGANDGRMR